MGPSGAKQVQMVPNGAKWCKTGSNGVKRGQKGPQRAYGAKRGPKGQMGPNEAKWGHMGLIFCMHACFYEFNIMFSNPGPQSKIGRAMAILSFSWIL